MSAVRFFGPIGENTGYGQAVRNFAEAFSKSGISTQFRFSKSNKNYLSELNNFEGSTNIDFYLHCPPYNRHQSNASYKIAYFYWEADRLPNFWIKHLNVLNEIWAPCELVKNACITAGFKGKIKVIPTPIREFSLKELIGIPSTFSDDYILSDEVYKFYSIFQWHERKGYKELIKSYLSEFNSDDNVVLILKVSALMTRGEDELKILKDIAKIKNFVNNKQPPPIFLSKKQIKSGDIVALHSVADCYVSPHHGEGWGLPIHDAMYAGKQIITTKFGGITEYLDQESAHIINHKMRPVSGMEWSSLYGPYQMWAVPNPQHLSSLMRDVYLNRNGYQNKASRAHEIAKSMSINNVSEIIKQEFSKR